MRNSKFEVDYLKFQKILNTYFEFQMLYLEFQIPIPNSKITYLEFQICIRNSKYLFRIPERIFGIRNMYLEFRIHI